MRKAARIVRLGVAALALWLAGSAARAGDPAAIWTLQGENASLSSQKVVDRYYTNGLRLGYASPEGQAPLGLGGIAGALIGPGEVRWSFDLTQKIYTPFETSAAVPPPGDRPYAGVLLGSFGLTGDSGNHRTSVSLGVGLVGPDAGAEAIQNRFHQLIGQQETRGWRSQLRDEPLLQLSASRVWRLPLGRAGALEADALPEISAGLGNLRVHAGAGLVVRVGKDLAADYGPARMSPAPSGGDAFADDGGFGWYLFAGLDGQAVGHDLTLDGNTFAASRHVRRLPLVGEAVAGFALRYRGIRLTYSHVVETEQFRGQKGGAHQLGSLALSVRF